MVTVAVCARHHAITTGLPLSQIEVLGA